MKTCQCGKLIAQSNFLEADAQPVVWMHVSNGEVFCNVSYQPDDQTAHPATWKYPAGSVQ